MVGGLEVLAAVVREAGKVIRVPRARLAEIAAEDEHLADLILRAYMARRSIMIEVGAGLKPGGLRFSSDTRRLPQVPARHRMAYPILHLDHDATARAASS